MLLKRFEEKVADLRGALNNESIRTEASEVIGEFDSVTIYRAGQAGAEAEVAARTEALIAFAANENGPRHFRIEGRSMAVVTAAGMKTSPIQHESPCGPKCSLQCSRR